jgi:hypothetical protein
MSNIKIFKNSDRRVFLSAADIYLYCNRRISYLDFLYISQISANTISKKKTAFTAYYYLEDVYYRLLKEYRNRRYISTLSYYFSLLIKSVYTIFQLFKSVFLRKNFEVYSISDRQIIRDRHTFSGGSKRLCPIINGTPIDDIDCWKINYVPFIYERMVILFACYKFKVYNFEIVLQNNILQNQLKKLNLSNVEFWVEEGTGLIQTYFLDFARCNGLNVKISVRGIVDTCFYRYGFEVLTDNIINLNILKKCNENVSLVKPYSLDFENINSEKPVKKKIGYLLDMGNFIMNYHDKVKMDSFIREISIKYKLNFILSIHPQEKNKNEKQYRMFFQDSRYIEFREGDVIEDFFNEIDILVGWMSTTIVQALFAKIPIILIDLFQEFPMKSLASLSEGLIEYANDEDSFLKYLSYFEGLSNSDINRKHDMAINAIQLM